MLKEEVLGLVFKKILGCSLFLSYIFLSNIKNTLEARKLIKDYLEILVKCLYMNKLVMLSVDKHMFIISVR